MKFLHTLDGKPACFWDDQICFMAGTRRTHPLAESKEQIKAELDATKKYRLKHRFGFDAKRYGYLKVE